MCKKILTAVLVVLTNSVFAMGQLPLERILFKKIPPSHYVEPIPPITPTSVTINPIEGLVVEDEIVLTSTENLYDIEITIVSDQGVVYSQNYDTLADEDIVIPTIGWVEGNYFIYIAVGEDIWTGNFEK